MCPTTSGAYKVINLNYVQLYWHISKQMNGNGIFLIESCNGIRIQITI
jgi:hypothetical protein